jgi:hypothetical protein
MVHGGEHGGSLTSGELHRRAMEKELRIEDLPFSIMLRQTTLLLAFLPRTNHLKESVLLAVGENNVVGSQKHNYI